MRPGRRTSGVLPSEEDASRRRKRHPRGWRLIGQYTAAVLKDPRAIRPTRYELCAYPVSITSPRAHFPMIEESGLFDYSVMRWLDARR
jgi:hypothetical protein